MKAGERTTWPGKRPSSFNARWERLADHLAVALAKFRSDDALRQSEERYRALIEGVDVAIGLIDADYNIVTVNAKQAAMAGYSPRELIGKKCYRQYEKREEVCPHCPGTRAMATSAPAEAEVAGERTSGSNFVVRIKASPIFDQAGRATGFIEAVEDIAERNRVAEALVKATRAAQAANRAKSEFLANMSHEIRTPMTAILGFSDLLMTPNLPYSEQREFLEGIQRNGKALLELIGDILDLSKIEAEKLTLEKVDCPLRPIVDDVLSAAAVWVERKGLRLKVDCEFPLPETIHTDPLRLRQILMNLLGNAVKFTSQGDVSFTIRCLREAAGPARIQFSVSDTGIGIPADKIGELFQPFTQVDGSANRRYGGTGLGLAISQRLATVLGGDIQVASEWGKGSTFTLTVDPGSLVGVPMGQQLKPVATGEAERLPHAPRLPLRGRLLLAEDDPAIQQIIGLLLQKMNLEVTIAENGHTACDMAEKSKAEGRPYDLILMDIQMPKRNGYEATQWLRQHGWQGPIVALTAHAMIGDREKCLAAGCDDYIAKPVILTGLWDVLTPYLGRTAVPADQIPEGDKADDDADVAAQ